MFPLHLQDAPDGRPSLAVLSLAPHRRARSLTPVHTLAEPARAAPSHPRQKRTRTSGGYVPTLPQGSMPAIRRSACTQERWGETQAPGCFRASGRGSGGSPAPGAPGANPGGWPGVGVSMPEGRGTARGRSRDATARQYIPRAQMCPLSASDPERSGLCRSPLVSSPLSRRGHTSAAPRPGTRGPLRQGSAEDAGRCIATHMALEPPQAFRVSLHDVLQPGDVLVVPTGFLF
jgi:hypothetical protein